MSTPSATRRQVGLTTYRLRHQMIDEAQKVVDAASAGTAGGSDKLSGMGCDVLMSHSGTIINHRLYPQDQLMAARRSCCKADGADLDIPLLANHDINCRPMGRMQSTKFTKLRAGGKKFDWLEPASQQLNKIVGEPSGILHGAVRVIDPKAIWDVQNGIYQGVSVGWTFGDMMCSVHKDGDFHQLDPWDEELCGHVPGNDYDGQLCYGIAQRIKVRELSFVNVPADAGAQIMMPRGQDSLMDQMFTDGDQIVLPSAQLVDADLKVFFTLENGERRSLDAADYKPTKLISIPKEKTNMTEAEIAALKAEKLAADKKATDALAAITVKEQELVALKTANDAAVATVKAELEAAKAQLKTASDQLAVQATKAHELNVSKLIELRTKRGVKIDAAKAEEYRKQLLARSSDSVACAIEDEELELASDALKSKTEKVEDPMGVDGEPAAKPKNEDRELSLDELMRGDLS